MIFKDARCLVFSEHMATMTTKNAKMAFSQLSVKAAAISGAVIGLIGGIFSALFRTSYRASPYLVRTGLNATNVTGYPTMVHSSGGFGFLAIIFGLIGGAIVGAVIAWVYNWALKLK